VTIAREVASLFAIKTSSNTVKKLFFGVIILKIKNVSIGRYRK
jgi:hypothetical protein